MVCYLVGEKNAKNICRTGLVRHSVIVDAPLQMRLSVAAIGLLIQ